MPFSLRTVLHLLLVLALTLNGIGTATAATRMQALHARALVEAATTGMPAGAGQGGQPASSISTGGAAMRAAPARHHGAAATPSAAPISRPPCHTPAAAATLATASPVAFPTAVVVAASPPSARSVADSNADGRAGAPVDTVATDTRNGSHGHNGSHAASHCRDASSAPAHATDHVDCCAGDGGDNGCDCPCAQHAYAISALPVLRIAAGVHATPAPSVPAGRDAPALPHLIRPPIG